MWKDYPVLLISPGMKILLALIIIWSLVWKGVALWKAARNNNRNWFIIMLIINTAGILEIIYILTINKKHTLENN